MTTLFQRLIGENLPESTLPEDQKIAIHAFTGAMWEWERGKITQGEAAGYFDLDTAQTTDAVALRNLFNAAPDKLEFMRVFKDWLYMGENSTDPKYESAGQLLTRLQEEVTDQGGTLP